MGYIRARADDTGDEFSLPEEASRENMTVLNEDATDVHGEPLPPTFGKKKAAKKETS